MKTIGIYLREARMARKVSLETLSDETKIKINFLKAIEDEAWESLPEYPVVSGFVKNISQYLSLEVSAVMAILRRDYPPSKRNIDASPAQPKKEASKFFSPKLRILFLGLIGALIVLIYLVRQYQVFSSPPELTVIAPIEAQTITTKEFSVRGKTSSDAVVKVNNQPVVVDDDGNFTADIEVSENLNDVTVKATSRAGKETLITRSIHVILQK